MIIHGLILAAGESNRLGQPKQLLTYKGHTLLARVLTQLEPLLSEVHVVLGANKDTIKKQIKLNHTISNPNWRQGMGSSLSYGIQKLPECDAVLIALCDQAFIPDGHYQQLINAAQTHPTHIIATQHKTCGVPAIFPSQFFKALSLLSADQGAKGIISKNQEVVKTLACPLAAFDVDTPSDVAQLNKIN